MKINYSANRGKLSKLYIYLNNINIINGKHHKKGDEIGKLIDLTGSRFERLTVIERDNSIDSSKGSYWICKCDCGNIKSISSHNLRNGSTKFCGCLNKEINSQPKIIQNMIGKKFGKLTVIKRSGSHITPSGQKKPLWLCKCDCGNEKIVQSQDLKTGHTKSCGCMSTKQKGSGLIDLTGKRFGKLTVVKRVEDYVYKSKNRELITSPRWLCKCDCGNIIIVQGGNLREGNTTYCGCKKNNSNGESLIANFLTKHNIKFLREYSFNDLRNKSGNLLRFDFAILDKNNQIIMLVEYQGKQHYIDCGSFGSYQRKYSDEMKRNYCKTNNIFLYEIKYDENLNDVLQKLLNEIYNNNKYKKINAFK